MGRLFPESATLAPEIHSQNTWDKILNRTGVIIKVLFVTSYICHSIRFHLVLFLLQLRFFQIGVQFLVVILISPVYNQITTYCDAAKDNRLYHRSRRTWQLKSRVCPPL